MHYVRKKATEEDLARVQRALNKLQRKLSPTPVCDFCADHKPTYFYEASRMSTGEWKRNWRWLACDLCADDIEHERWGKVLGRISDKIEDLWSDFPAELRPPAAALAFKEFLLYAVPR